MTIELREHVLSSAEWTERERAHHHRADAMTAGRRERAARGAQHPVDDFLYTYYSYKPAVLRRWHPGLGVLLEDAASTPRAGWRGYSSNARGDVWVDAASVAAERTGMLRSIAVILRGSLERPASFGCFGMHEWAMVYREPETRHAVPLRLGAAATDAVVDAHELRCTHFDAFRFFTADAEPRNREHLDRASQPRLEQAGCLHAGMDLYKWSVKLGPLVPGDLLLDAFELARDIRELDMRASPYDLTAWGYEPVPVETAQGKADYIALQRSFTERGAPIRRALVDLIETALG